MARLKTYNNRRRKKSNITEYFYHMYPQGGVTMCYQWEKRCGKWKRHTPRGTVTRYWLNPN